MVSFLFVSALAVAVLSADSPAPAPKASPSPPPSVDLRPRFERWGLERRRQGARGTCSVFTVTGALEYALARKTDRGVRLSVEYLNWAGHKAANRTADGGFFSELWDGYAKYGIAPESELPYRPEYDAALQPPPAALESAKAAAAHSLRLHWIKEWDPKIGLTASQFEKVKTTLSSGHPICGGFRWPKKEQWDRQVLKMCPPEAVFDGHSVLLVGYRDDLKQPGGGVFIIRNSGGEGKDGFLPYEYVRAYLNDAAWIE